jgi:hypothetical protein
MAGGGGGFDVREPAIERQSSFYQMEDGISGADEPMASDTPVSERIASGAFSEEPQC